MLICIVFVVLTVIIITGIEIEDVLYVNWGQHHYRYFVCRFLDYCVVGKHEGSLSGLSILEITGKKPDFPGVVVANGDRYIPWIMNDGIHVYSLDGTLLERYSINDGETIISSCVSNLNDDGTDEILLITGKKGEEYGENLIVLSFDGEFKEVFRKTFVSMNPWKVQTCDVDGDGRREISIGVYKKAEFHPIMARRPFIYDWHGDSIAPKWRGSRLSRPFDDYIFVDIDSDGMDEIVSIELLADGRKVINSYKWKGFGFEGIGESRAFEDVLMIKRGCSNGEASIVYAKVKRERSFEWVAMHYDDGKLVVKKRLKKYTPRIVVN